VGAPVNASGVCRWLGFGSGASFVGGCWFDGVMPRKRDRDAARVVHRTARCGLRATRTQRNRLFGLLRSAGDVWCAVLGLNRWRRARQDAPLAGYQELCRQLAASGLAPSGNSTAPGPGRCCAGTPTRGSPPRNGAGREIPRRGTPGAGGALSRSAGTRARSPWTAGCSASRQRGAVRRCWCAWTYPPGQTPPGWPGWTWASSTPTRWRDQAGSSCWCPGGRSGPSAASTCGTATTRLRSPGRHRPAPDGNHPPGESLAHQRGARKPPAPANLPTDALVFDSG